MIVAGIHPLKEALSTTQEFDKIMYSREMKNPDVQKIIEIAKERGIPAKSVPKIKLDKLSKINHQGILGIMSSIKFVSLDEITENHTPKSIYLILDSVTDSRNFGAICRTAECMGVSGIVIPKNNSSPTGEGAVKSSAGALLKLKICRVTHLLDAVYHFQANDIMVISCTEKAQENINEASTLENGVAVVMGSEDKGVNNRILKASDNHYKIKMYGSIESLNVGVATGMILYQLRNIIA